MQASTSSNSCMPPRSAPHAVLAGRGPPPSCPGRQLKHHERRLLAPACVPLPACPRDARLPLGACHHINSSAACMASVRDARLPLGACRHTSLSLPLQCTPCSRRAVVYASTSAGQHRVHAGHGRQGACGGTSRQMHASRRTHTARAHASTRCAPPRGARLREVHASARCMPPRAYRPLAGFPLACAHLHASPRPQRIP